MTRRLSGLAAIVLYVAVTVSITWPVALRIGKVVPHDLGDPLLSTWLLWWNGQVIPFTDRWWHPPAFFPMPHAMALSDHRVGISVLTTPLMKAGIAPLAAYDVAFLLSFVLCAAGAYRLCHALTRRRDAAFLGGLIFGFHPFRAAHLEHLELLAAYWLPVILLAAHSWARTQSIGSLSLLAAALTMQLLTSSYYFAFMSILLALWVLWFTPRTVSLKQYGFAALAVSIPLSVAVPILLRYSDAHRRLGLSRSTAEIELFSADAIDLFRPPALLAIWPTFNWDSQETALMPELIAVALVAAGYWAGTRLSRPIAETKSARRVRIVMLLLAAALALVALAPRMVGPIAYEVGPIGISVTHSYKPFSMSVLLICGWLLTAPVVRRAWRERSAFAFYTLASIAMLVFALGPTARLLGHRIVYMPPYSWLMILPGFRDGFRAPARFAMLAALTTTVAAALAYSRLFDRSGGRSRVAATVLCVAGILVDSWIYPFPVHPAPAPLEVPSDVPKEAVILELPLGPFENSVAMYHSISHGRRTVNGMSGYVPLHYALLDVALREQRVGVLEPLAEHADVAIYLERNAAGDALHALLLDRLGAIPLKTVDKHHVVLLQQRQPTRTHTSGRRRISIQALTSDTSAQDLSAMTDGDVATAWSTKTAQLGTESVTADISSVVEVNSISLNIGTRVGEFPRVLAIETSANLTDWTEVWRGDTAGETMRAVLEQPRLVTVDFRFPAIAARYLRIRQIDQSEYPWSIAEIVIYADVGR